MIGRRQTQTNAEKNKTCMSLRGVLFERNRGELQAHTAMKS